MFENRVTTEAALREIYRSPPDMVVAKIGSALGRHERDFIAASPFVLIGSSSPDGTGDVSPKGGPPGFVAVLDDEHLAVGDLSGNNLLDTLTNVVHGSGVGLIFLVPGIDETLRVNGQACITTDPAVLDRCAIRDRRPKTALGVTITQQYMHCAKAFRRSGLWDTATWPADGQVPTIAEIVADSLGLDDDGAEGIDAALEDDYTATMWEPGGRPDITLD